MASKSLTQTGSESRCVTVRGETTPLVLRDDEVRGLASTMTIYLIAMAVSTGGAAALATQYFLKDTFNLGPAEIAFYLSFHSIGWVVKPIWGFISDSFPIFGQRRRPYLVIVAGLGALGFIAYGVVQTISQFLTVLVFTHSCMAFLTVIAQALLVQRSGNQNLQVASFNFSTFFGLPAACGAVTTFGAGVLLDQKPARLVLMLCAGLFVTLLMPVPFMRERQDSPTLRLTEQCKTVAQLFKKPEVWGVTLYIFVFCSMPNASSAMFFFNVDVLNFSATFLATIAAVSAVAQVLGLALYHCCLTGVPFRILFGTATLACAILSATPLIQVWRLNRAWGIDDHVFAVVDTFVIQLVAEILWIPMLVLASRLCPPSVEGMTYALFLSIHNLGFFVSGQVSGALIHLLGIARSDLSNIWLLIVLCCLSTLMPLFLLPLLPDKDPEAMRDSENVLER